MNTQKISKCKLSLLKPNPDNPRIIKDYKFKKLVQSIKDFPQMLELRPIVVNEDNLVLGGNMRLKACEEAGLKEVHIIQAKDLTPEQQKEFIVKDNVGFGEWDWDILANDWNAEQLNDWGLDVWQPTEVSDLEDFFAESNDQQKEEKKDPMLWYDLFMDYVQQKDQELYNQASKYADENQ